MIEDAALVALWLNGRPPTTRRIYAREIGRLTASLNETALGAAALEDCQRYIESLAHLAPRTRGLAVAALKSFFSFHAKVGTLQANPAAALLTPAVPETLAERILTEDDIAKLMCAAGLSTIEQLMLRLLYSGGIRAGELTTLYSRQVVARADGLGQITVHGKGGKTRAVLLPAAIFAGLVDLKGNKRPADPVFPSQSDPARPIGQRSLLRIVKRAAAGAGLSDKISMHWFRHSHASHALDAGCPISVVRDTLGHASIATTNRYVHAKPGASSATYLKPPQAE